MNDKPESRPDAKHAERVDGAFDSLVERVGHRLDEPGRGLVARLREAAAEKDAEALRTGLTEARDRHGWLYRELAQHPDLATLLDELALWGF